MKLHSLPLEVWQAIMCTLPDVNSLRSMAITCSSFYQIFTTAETVITARVLRNEMQFDVLPEAVAVLEVSRAGIRSPADAKRFLSMQLQARSRAPQMITLSDAVSMIKLHGLVRSFAEDLATQSLFLLTRDAPKYETSEPPPSSLELARIQRALYRYQMYSKIFHDLNIYHPSDSETVAWHGSRLSPCEKEQLGCVQLFMETKIGQRKIRNG
jgi:hypothetical protein